MGYSNSISHIMTRMQPAYDIARTQKTAEQHSHPPLSAFRSPTLTAKKIPGPFWALFRIVGFSPHVTDIVRDHLLAEKPTRVRPISAHFRHCEEAIEKLPTKQSLGE